MPKPEFTDFAIRTRPEFGLFLVARWDAVQGKYQLITMVGNGWVCENEAVAVNVASSFIRRHKTETVAIFVVFHGPQVVPMSFWGYSRAGRNSFIKPLCPDEMSETAFAGLNLFAKDIAEAIDNRLSLKVEINK
jgi:hypothetical protein